MKNIEFVAIPNLPKNKINCVIISKITSFTVKSSLKSMGIRQIDSYHFTNVPSGICTHSDLGIWHVGKDWWIASPESFSYYQKVLPENIRLSKGKKMVGSEYPSDVPYNAAQLYPYVFHNFKETDSAIIESIKALKLKPIQIKQGYAKCNLCIVSRDAVITEDAGIERIARQLGLDVLKIPAGNISLKGYAYGFIGGATGLLAQDTLGITGIFENKKIENQIKDFCKNHHVYIEHLDKGIPEDIGSILPVTEICISNSVK